MLYPVLSVGVGDGSALHFAYIMSRKKTFYPFNRRLVGPQNRSECYFNTCTMHLMGACGGIVVKAVRYKLAGRGFDSRWYHWNFSVS